MDVPKLSLPPKDYSYLDSVLDSSIKTTFAGTLRTAMYDYQNTKNAQIWFKFSDAESKLKEKACDAANRYYDAMRCKIDEEMQAYILEHNGRIDSWGDPAGSVVSRYTTVKDAQFIFDYFGEDYKVTFSENVVRKSSKLVYRNHYRFPGTKEFNAAETRRKKLEHDIQKNKEKGGSFLRLLCLIGFLYLLFGILSILGNMFLGLGGTIDAFVEENMTLGIVIALPYVLYSVIRGIFGSLSSSMAIFFIIMLLGACLIGALRCFSYFLSFHKNVRTAKQMKRELNSLTNSADYIRIAAENEELRKKNEALADQWHRAWYRWVCSIKSSAKDANETSTV